jgi:hypothetical protein
MNTLRDPFSIRSKSPAHQLLRQPAHQILRQSLFLAAQNAAQNISTEVQKTAQTVVLPAVGSAVESAKEIAQETLDQMSFSIPKNVPSFQSAQRDFESQAWASRFSRQKDLPLYKDKPYYNNSSVVQRRMTLRRKRVLLGLAALLFFAYWFGVFSGDGVKLPTTLRKPSVFPDTVDWDARREKVKAVMAESWAAYERDAWGNAPHHDLPFCSTTIANGLTVLGHLQQDLISMAPSVEPVGRWALKLLGGSLLMLSTP